MAGLMVAGMVAGSLISGAVQYQTAKEATRAQKEAAKKAMEIASKLQKPDFNWQKLTPEEFKVIQQFSPQYTEFVAEQAPQVVEMESEAAKAAKAAQMEALGKYRTLAETGRDIESDILTSRARQEVGAADRALKAQMLQDIRRRGIGGGAEIAASLASAQAAGDRGARMAEDAAMEAARRRLEAIRQTGALGGQIRGQEFTEEARNIDIINEFNRRQAARRQAWAGEQADIANRAQLYNIGQTQTAADRNVELRNLYARENLERENRLKQLEYQAERDKAAMMTGQYGAQADIARQEAQDKSRLIGGITEAGMTGLKYGYESLRDKKKKKDDDTL